MSIETMWKDEIQNELKELGRLDAGTEEYKGTADAVTKMMVQLNESKKIDLEREKVEIELRRLDADISKNQDDRRDKFAKNCIAVGTFGLSLVAYGAAFIMSTNFERIGTFTTQGGKISIRELLKLKS